MRCTRDDSLPRENTPFEVRVFERPDLLLTEVEHWLRDNGTGWYALDFKIDPRRGLIWIYNLSDRETAFWLNMTFGGA